MNKTAIKNFAIWARNKLIADITYKAGLMGVTDKGIAAPLPQSTGDMQFFDIGTSAPYSITGKEIEQRRRLADIITDKAKESDYITAFNAVVEEVAYTWFNRLIAVRFMEVNDYLPSRVRVLSSESKGKSEPDLVTAPFDADLDFNSKEKELIAKLKLDNKLDDLFRLLFIKQCNALNAILPELFEKTSDYTELLLNISYTDKDGVVAHLVNDIDEDDFNVKKETGQIEIIGWLYQFYNTELNEQVYDGNMSKSRVPKELLPAATTIYTPDWAIRYMVENSLGKLWLEKNLNSEIKANWKYYIDDAEQISPHSSNAAAPRLEEIKLIDPCMGSGHILVYAFDVFMLMYESQGYTQRDAAKMILENNIHGLDIDKRAYQLSYFALLMKARQYNRRILFENIQPQLYHPTGDSDGEEIGSALLINERLGMPQESSGQLTLADMAYEERLRIWNFKRLLQQKYDVVITNPPYLGSSRFSPALSEYVQKHYADVKSDLSMVMFKKAINDLVRTGGYVSFITTSSWMFLKSFESIRSTIIGTMQFESIVDFGTELFDGKVGHNPIVAWVNRKIAPYKQTTAIRLVDYCYSRRDEKEPEFFEQRNRYTANADNFAKIPGMPIAYWASKNFLMIFESNNVATYATVTNGMFTCDNKRFLRAWYEISKLNFNNNCSTKKECIDDPRKWYPYNKGGNFKRWYGNHEYVINFKNFGKEIANYRVESGQSASFPGQDYYFSESISWSLVSSSKFGIRYYPSGFVFDIAGSSVFANKKEQQTSILAFLASDISFLVMNMVNPTINFQVGDVRLLPVNDVMFTYPTIDCLAKANIDISRVDWDSFEVSWNFKRHPLIDAHLPMVKQHSPGEKWEAAALEEHPKYKVPYAVGSDRADGLVKRAFEVWQEYCEKQFVTLKANEKELNRIFIDIYGLQDELTSDVADKDVTIARIYDSKDDIPESMKGNAYVLTKMDVVKSFVSYAVGCMFGRYSPYKEGLLFAGGDLNAYFELHRNTHNDLSQHTWGELSKFTYAQLQKPYYYLKGQECSPFDGIHIDADNVLPITDEEYFEDDIVGLFIDFVKKIYGVGTLEENLAFIANALGNKGNSSREIIRNYFVKDFFKDHCKTYQKRPIYWLFDSGKQDGFKALVYMHRYDENTIGNLRIDYLHRIQRVYDSEIARMQDTIDNGTDGREIASAEKRKEKLTKQLKETKDYDAKIAHLALARIAIDLDDGVKVNYEKVQTGTDGKKLDVLGKI